MEISNIKIKEKLKKHLGRDPTLNEEENAKKDPNIRIEILEDEIDAINIILIKNNIK